MVCHTTQQVMSRENPDQVALIVHDWHGMDLFIQHDARNFSNFRQWRGGDDAGGHYLGKFSEA